MAKMTRREFIKASGTIAAGGLAASALGRAEAMRKPNILFILADDLGYGDLGCFGQELIETPNLDRLAAEGLRMTDFYAASTVCAPSRCGLMTGLHMGHARIRGNARVPLLPEDLTVAEVLREAGYRTGLIGKWGLGEAGSTGIPTRQGFDFFFGYLNQRHAHNYYPSFLWRNEEKVSLRNVVQPASDRPGELGGAAIERLDYSHDLFTWEALRFIDENAERPFFLYLAYTIPHANNEAKRVLNRDGMEVPDYGIYADRDWPEPQKGTAAMITRMDRDIGRIVDRLKALGIAEDTLIFFSSDNGPHREGGNDPTFFRSSGPLRGIKRDLYEGGIRVPTIAWWPRVIAPDRVSAHAGAFWDFLPTAAEIAGVEPPSGIDGLSFLPLLRGESQPAHEYLYWEFFEQGGKQAVRMGDWKAVRLKRKGNPDAPIELYNLAEDLSETKDVATAHPKIVAQMREIMETARTESPHWSFDG